MEESDTLVVRVPVSLKRKPPQGLEEYEIPQSKSTSNVNISLRNIFCDFIIINICKDLI